MTIKQFSEHFNEALKDVFNDRELHQHLSILLDYYGGFSRSDLILFEDKIVDPKVLDKLKKAIVELLENKPIDYIINQSVFFGYEFFVDERVLIPRSETEELVQWVLEEEQNAQLDILDIGSGSGCIPIVLDLEGNYKKVDACEISVVANEVAIINADKLKSKVKFQQLDILTQTLDKKYDVVVSNPPYVKQEELKGLDKNVIEYEPQIALAPEGDPLTFYKRMIELAPQILKPNGRFYWEIHEDLGKEVIELLNTANFKAVELKQDIYGRDRLVRGRIVL